MRRLRNILIVLLVIILLLVGAATGFVVMTTRRPLPQVAGTLSLAGLDGTVTIYRDSYGVPQIYATTSRDLFFAQGLVMAQDRWWQMEFNRHTGMGRIGELTGKNDRVLRNDIFIRTEGWPRAAQADLAAASPESLSALNAFSAGINAYIEGKSGPDLAVEYSLLAVKGVKIPIEKWEPVHSLAWAKVMAYDLGGNMDEELERTTLYKKFGSEAATMVEGYYAPPFPYGKKPTIVTAADLPVKAEPAAAYQVPAVAPGTNIAAISTALIGARPDFLVPGLSNNWVISGKLTQSGKPILANDMHLGQQMPSIWYLNGLHCVQLSAECPYDVTGYSFPGVPGVIVGHNARIAWGVTNAGPDVQDLYAIKIDPNDSTKYEVDGKSENMQVITETIKFGDGAPSQDIKVRVTRFGPIITDTPSYAKSSDTPLAIKWTATAETYDILGAVMAINRATDWQTFRQALTKWGAPAQNFVYADVDGNIGYQMPGLVPIRAKDHSGLLPVDGSTTQYDWKGYIPFENMPRIFNPERGYIESANQNPVPLEYFTQLADQLGDKYGKDSNYMFGVNFDWGYRAARIASLIEAKDKHTVDSVKAIHADTYSGGAAELLPALLKLDYGSDVPKEVIDWMGQWDYQESMDSGQAALYESFWAQLMKKLWGDQLGYTPDGTNVAWGTTLLLDQPDNVWWDDVTTTNKKETRDDILRAAFVDAYQDATRQLGADYKTWKWGKLHTVKFVSNPIGASGIDVLENFVNMGPEPVNGGSLTINRTAWNASNPFVTSSISSMRMIVNLGDLNTSQWINPTGQSGHPTSPHYRDMNEMWRLVQYLPMQFDATTIRALAASTLVLQPK